MRMRTKTRIENKNEDEDEHEAMLMMEMSAMVNGERDEHNEGRRRSSNMPLQRHGAGHAALAPLNGRRQGVRPLKI